MHHLVIKIRVLLDKHRGEREKESENRRKREEQKKVNAYTAISNLSGINHLPALYDLSILGVYCCATSLIDINHHVYPICSQILQTDAITHNTQQDTKKYK